eukprot:749369-Hanusia_phi.AAC.3
MVVKANNGYAAKTFASLPDLSKVTRGLAAAAAGDGAAGVTGRHVDPRPHHPDQESPCHHPRLPGRNRAGRQELRV